MERRSRFPIAKVCPACGSSKYTWIDPEEFAWTRDKICTNCQTRYTPPMPAAGPWMAIGFGAIGLAASAWALYDTFTAKGGARFTVWACGVFILASLMALMIGVSLLRVRKQSS